MNRTNRFAHIALCMVACLPACLPALADATSPHIDDRGLIYSKEAPDTAFYGTGTSGHLSEASALRFDVEQDIQDHKWDIAIRKSAKAVELDPGYPDGHLLYARALTGKLYANKGPVDETLLRQAMGEWKVLALHDADYGDQSEARYYWKKMYRISRALMKAKKNREEQETELARKQHPDTDAAGAQVAVKQHPKDE